MLIRLLAQQKFPTLQEIQRRMERRLGWMPLQSCVVTPCAEEAERIMHEVWLNAALSGEQVQTITIKADFPGDRCTCPNCYQRSIFRSHNYCPKCGSRIIWINQ